jgi:hypothetical protein
MVPHVSRICTSCAGVFFLIQKVSQHRLSSNQKAPQGNIVPGKYQFYPVYTLSVADLGTAGLSTEADNHHICSH